MLAITDCLAAGAEHEEPEFGELWISGWMAAGAALVRGRTVEEPVAEVEEPLDEVVLHGAVGLINGAPRMRAMASSSKS